MVVAVLAAIVVFAAGHKTILMGKNQTVVAVLEEHRTPLGMAARARSQVAVAVPVGSQNSVVGIVG